MSGSGLEVTDQVHTITVPWNVVRRITASMGRQQFDGTPTLLIDHEAGRSIFLYEGEPLWTPFLDAAAVYLHPILPAADWFQNLAESPDAAIQVYRRSSQMF